MTNNNTWLRVSLALLGIVVIFSVGVTSFSLKTTVANNARIAVLETNQNYMQRQLDRIETKLDILLTAPTAAARLQALQGEEE